MIMLFVKSIKPYSIRVDSEYIYVTLAYCSFTIAINETIYYFIPNISNAIIVDRFTRKVQNTEAIFTFQHKEKAIHIGMGELICLPEFLFQLEYITEPFYTKKEAYMSGSDTEQGDVLTELFVEELEQLNIKVLIDRALDEQDKDMFYELTKYL